MLTISSSELHPKPMKNGDLVQFGHVGNLLRGLPRLFPFLFSRSQVEDALSVEVALVAALSPEIGEDIDWPNLLDFRSSSVNKIIRVAHENLDMNRRIGTIESWGPPTCLMDDKRIACSQENTRR